MWGGFMPFSSVHTYPTSPQQTGCDKRSVFKQSKAGLNSEFSFLLNWLPEPSLSYLTLAGERTDGFMFFLRALAQSET